VVGYGIVLAYSEMDCAMTVKIPKGTRPTHLWIDDKGNAFVGVFVTEKEFAPMCDDNLTWEKKTITINPDHASPLPFREPCASLLGTKESVDARTRRIPYASSVRVKSYGLIKDNLDVGKLQRELNRIGWKHQDGQMSLF
jgi:hypothetical protein